MELIWRLLLIEKIIIYPNQVDIRLHPNGIEALAFEVTQPIQETQA